MATRRVAPRPANAEENLSHAGNRAAPPAVLPADWGRPVLSPLRPLVDGGRRPSKAAIGDAVTVEAEAFVEGHDVLTCDLLFRPESASNWSSAPMVPQGDDIWRGEFSVTTMGCHRYAVYAKVDRFLTWRRDLHARMEAGQDVTLELLVGAELIDAAAKRATSTAQRLLSLVAADLWTGVKGIDGDVSEEVADGTGASTLIDLVFSDMLALLMDRFCDPAHSLTSEIYSVMADREKARFSTWYEMFPRSASADADRHGTFADVRAKLPYVAHMGFDVLYLPPIHPIGRTGRKGRDGATHAGPEDPGSPWAIGSAEGGHRSVHPDLGTLEDFGELVTAAAARGIDVAIDLAFQASPDHPWVRDHPAWFRHLPDGSIRYAENPPKRYEDIYPLDFETDDWQALWAELLDVVRFWVGQGVKVFRVDNPHTKPFAFWEWMIKLVKADDPEVIFLSEAFTPPGGDATPGQGGVHPVVHLLHLAQHQVGARDIPHGTDQDRRGRVLSPQLLAQHAGHPATSRSRRGVVPPSWRAWSSRPRSARITGSTAPPSNCRSTFPAPPVPRSTHARRSTRSDRGTWHARTASQSSSRG